MILAELLYMGKHSKKFKERLIKLPFCFLWMNEFLFRFCGATVQQIWKLKNKKRNEPSVRQVAAPVVARMLLLMQEQGVGVAAETIAHSYKCLPLQKCFKRTFLFMLVYKYPCVWVWRIITANLVMNFFWCDVLNIACISMLNVNTTPWMFSLRRFSVFQYGPEVFK